MEEEPKEKEIKFKISKEMYLKICKVILLIGCGFLLGYAIGIGYGIDYANSFNQEVMKDCICGVIKPIESISLLNFSLN